jgi:heat shock protein HslJ
MLKQIFLLIAISALIVMSCNKDKTDIFDITEHQWKLMSVTVENETFKPKENKSRYVLEFISGTHFSFDLSINDGGAKFEIHSKGEIDIENGAFTEICCNNEFDEKLLEVFPKNNVFTYTVIGNTLTLKSTDGEVKFKKKW